MQLGKFRELTKFLPDDVDLIFEARSNPCGNCWDNYSLEATQLSFFGIKRKSIKLLVETPGYVNDECSPESILVHPTYGIWINEYINPTRQQNVP